MATDNKNNKKTAEKLVDTSKGANAEQSDKAKLADIEGKSAQELEALQNGAITTPVVVEPTAEQKAELLRITEVLRIAYEGKGSFKDDMDEKEMFELLAGKTDEEIVELVKPYFIFTDGSQDNPEEKDKTSQGDELDQAKGLVDTIKEIAGSDKPEVKEGDCKETIRIQAKKLMRDQNLKEIWRCPVKDYWFSRKDYAENYKRKNECSLEHYKKL